MKNTRIFFLFLVISGTIGLLGFRSESLRNVEKVNTNNYHTNYQSGSPGGRTGAPGESTCTSCHSGTVQSGDGFQTVVLTDASSNVVSMYEPGQIYTVTVTMATSNVKNGFEIVALTPSNTQAGNVSVTNATTTKTVTSGGKTRITQKTAGTPLQSWSFDWTAPTSNIGTVTFYLATNQTNVDGSDSGDIIRTSQHSFGSVAGITEHPNKLSVNLGYASEKHSLTIDLTSISSGEVTLNVVDLKGISVQFEQIGKAAAGENSYEVKLNRGLSAGVYVVHVGVNNHFVSKKMYID